MQLTLIAPFAKPAPVAGPVSQRGAVVPSRESVAMAQLDRIAAQNLRSPAHGLGASGMLLALLGGLVVLGSASMWNRAAGDDPRTAGLTADSTAVTAVTPASPPPSPSPAAIVLPVIAAQVGPGSVVAPSALPAAQPATADTVAAAEPSAAEPARKARARQLAEARRKSAQLAQERAAAQESQHLQLAQQREAERAQQQQLAEQARQRAAAEQARLQTVQLALNTQRSVGDACSASRGAISRHFCSARECSKPEHQGDPVCVSLREDDLARQRASNER